MAGPAPRGVFAEANEANVGPPARGIPGFRAPTCRSAHEGYPRLQSLQNCWSCHEGGFCRRAGQFASNCPRLQAVVGFHAFQLPHEEHSSALLARGVLDESESVRRRRWQQKGASASPPGKLPASLAPPSPRTGPAVRGLIHFQ